MFNTSPASSLLRAAGPTPLLAVPGSVAHHPGPAKKESAVPKACPQSWPCGVAYSRQPALSSRAGQGAPPFRGSRCTARLRTRAVGRHWPAQPLQGLHSPTMHGRAEKQHHGDAHLSTASAGQAVPAKTPASSGYGTHNVDTDATRPDGELINGYPLEAGGCSRIMKVGLSQDPAE